MGLSSLLVRHVGAPGRHDLMAHVRTRLLTMPLHRVLLHLLLLRVTAACLRSWLLAPLHHMLRPLRGHAVALPWERATALRLSHARLHLLLLLLLLQIARLLSITRATGALSTHLRHLILKVAHVPADLAREARVRLPLLTGLRWALRWCARRSTCVAISLHGGVAWLLTARSRPIHHLLLSLHLSL